MLFTNPLPKLCDQFNQYNSNFKAINNYNMSASKRVIQPTVGELLSPFKSYSRQKLEAEFYQDIGTHHKQIQRSRRQIADDVLNQIIAQKTNKAQQNSVIQQSNKLLNHHQQERAFEQKKFNRNSEKELKTQKKMQKSQQFFSPYRVISRNVQQDQIHEQQRTVNNIEHSKERKAKQSENMESPFGKQSLFLQQKRFELERQYFQALKRQIQQKSSANIKSKLNDKKFHDFKILQSKQQRQKDRVPSYSPRGRGKNDPNGQPPLFSQYIWESDILYIRNKAEQLSRKLKKGRIDRNQYDSQIKKIEIFYGKPMKELLPTQRSHQSQILEKNLLKLNKQVGKQTEKQQFQIEEATPQKDTRVNSVLDNIHTEKHNSKQDIVYNQTAKQKLDMINPPQYEQAAKQSNLFQKFAAMQLEMMNSMIKQMKELYKSSLQSDKNFVQNTIAKYQMQILPRNYQHEEEYSRNFIQKNLQQNQNSQRIINAKRFNQKPYSNISKPSLREIQKFYQKPYKVQHLKNFEYLQDIRQSQYQIPSSHQIQRHFETELKKNFERDLQTYKRIQKKHEAQKLVKSRQRKMNENQIYFDYLGKVSSKSQKQSNQKEVVKQQNQSQREPLIMKLYIEDPIDVDISQIQKIKPKFHRKLKKQLREQINLKNVNKQIVKKGQIDLPLHKQHNVQEKSEKKTINQDDENAQERSYKQQQSYQNDRLYRSNGPKMQKKGKKNQFDYKQQKHNQMKKGNILASSPQKRKKESQIKIKFPINVRSEKGVQSRVNEQQNELNCDYQHEKRMQFNRPLIVSPNKRSKVHQGSSIKSLQQARQIIHQSNCFDSNSHCYSVKRRSDGKPIKAEEYSNGLPKEDIFRGYQNNWPSKRETYQQSHRNIIKILDQLTERSSDNHQN